MFWTLVFALLAVAIMIKVLSLFQVRSISAQMWGNSVTSRPKEALEVDVVNLSLSYFKTVILRMGTPYITRLTQLIFYGAFYVSTLVVATDIVVLHGLLNNHGKFEQLLAFASAIIAFYALLLYVLSFFVEAIFTRESVNINKREKKWYKDNKITPDIITKFKKNAEVVYGFIGTPNCSIPFWFNPTGFIPMIVVVANLFLLSLIDVVAIQKVVPLSTALLPDLLFFVIVLIVGLPVLMLKVMRIAPWNGVSASTPSLPFRYFWYRITGA
jgi:hypothetical protein